MSTAARIDELRKKFEENPRRYFAPLANEYRKAGDLPQAIALCREHLPKQPGHMSGYIVFGQALYESGELAEARSVFEQALDLDPENLIALRHLGDIARASGDASSARRWYERVLDADPRNDDIAAQLATLAVTRTPISSPAVASSQQPFVRPIDTPPIPMTPVGFGITPTPDSVMRAIDLDAIAARVARPTPLDLDAIEHAAASFEAPVPHAEPAPIEVPASSPSATSMEPIDVGEDEEMVPTASFADLAAETDPVPAVEPTPEPVAVAAPTPSPRDEADAFDFPEPTPEFSEPADPAAAVPTVAAEHSAMVVEMASGQYAAVETSDQAPTFEEGLVAPVWPDTTELVSRLTTPRVSSPHAFTPVSSEAVADAVAAFGEERPFAAAAEPSLAPDVEPIVSAEHAPPERESESTDAEEDLIDFSTFSESTVVSELAAPSEAPSTVDEEADEASAISAEAVELPWLAVPESPRVDHVAEVSEQPGLEELAEAFADDARAVGHGSEVTVVTVDQVVDGGEITSFADIAPPADEVASFVDVDTPAAAQWDDPSVFNVASRYADEPTEFAAPDASVAFVEASEHDEEQFEAPRLDESPAFVTETMAELLVSQGFIGRAADVYEELVRRRPFDPVLDARLTELRAMLEPAPAAQFVTATSDDESAASAVDESTESLFADVGSEYENEGVRAFTTKAVSDKPRDVGVVHDVDMTHAEPTPAYGTPLYNTPISAPPVFATPVGSASLTPAGSSLVTPPSVPRVTPYSQPAVEELAPRRSAREWFAMLAARRVPRRTPAQSAPVVEQSPEGLATLFGADPSHHDDSAARALADAFAPVDSQLLSTGATFDFEFARTTPSFAAAAVAPAMVTPVVPTRAQHATPAGTFAPIPPSGESGNAGFAFDKFFPDPATRRGTPAAAMPATPDAPVTDDLAQFSAWLKGLGNT